MDDTKTYRHLKICICPNCKVSYGLWEFYDLGLHAAEFDHALQCGSCKAVYGVKNGPVVNSQGQCEEGTATRLDIL